MSRHDGAALRNFLVAFAAFVVVIAGLKAAQAIVVPILMACFVAILSAPMLLALTRRGLPDWMALLIVVLFIMVLASVLVVMLTSLLGDFSQSLPFYQARFEKLIGDTLHKLGSWGLDVPERLTVDLINPAKIFGVAAGAVNSVTGLLANAFLIALTVVFILTEIPTLSRKLVMFSSDAESSISTMRNFGIKINDYMKIKVATSLLTGVIIFFWLLMVGVDFPLLWAILAFLLNFVPTIGSIIAAVPALVLALIQLGPGSALLALVGYLLVNNIVGNVIEPKFMGRGLGLSALIVFLSLVFWGWVLGPIGMFLSVPLTLLVKLALDSHAETRRIGLLLGDESGVKACEEKNVVTDQA